MLVNLWRAPKPQICEATQYSQACPIQCSASRHGAGTEVVEDAVAPCHRSDRRVDKRSHERGEDQVPQRNRRLGSK